MRVVILIILLPILLFGQAKTFLPFPVTSSNGRPINNADVDLYIAGTNNKQADLTYLPGSGGWYYWTGDTSTVPSGNYDVWVNGIVWRTNVKLNVVNKDIEDKIYGNSAATDTVAKRGLWKITHGSFAFDTTALKQNDEGVYCYLAGLSATNRNGSGWFVEMDSTYPEGVVAFHHPVNGKQWVRVDFLKDNEVNILWAGAVPDDNNPDEFYIKKAWNSLPDNGGILLIPKGVFYIGDGTTTQPLYLRDKNNVRIYNYGTLKLSNDAQKDTPGAVRLIAFHNTDGLYFEGGILDGNSSNQPNWTGGYNGEASGILLWVTNSVGDTTKNVTIRNVTFKNAFGQAFNGTFIDLLIEGCTYDSVGEGLLATGKGLRFINNYCGYTFAQDGIEPYYANGVVIAGNIFFGANNTNNSEIDVYYCRNVRIYDNVRMGNYKGKNKMELDLISATANGDSLCNIWIHDNEFTSAQIGGKGMGIYIHDNYFENVSFRDLPVLRFYGDILKDRKIVIHHNKFIQNSAVNQATIQFEGSVDGIELSNNEIINNNSAIGIGGAAIAFKGGSGIDTLRNIDILFNKIKSNGHGIGWYSLEPVAYFRVHGNRIESAADLNDANGTVQWSTFDIMDNESIRDFYYYKGKLTSTGYTTYEGTSIGGTGPVVDSTLVVEKGKHWYYLPTDRNIVSIDGSAVGWGTIIYLTSRYTVLYYVKDGNNIYLNNNLNFQIGRDDVLTLIKLQRFDGTEAWYEVSRTTN